MTEFRRSEENYKERSKAVIRRQLQASEESEMHTYTINTTHTNTSFILPFPYYIHVHTHTDTNTIFYPTMFIIYVYMQLILVEIYPMIKSKMLLKRMSM